MLINRLWLWVIRSFLVIFRLISGGLFLIRLFLILVIPTWSPWMDELVLKVFTRVFIDQIIWSLRSVCPLLSNDIIRRDKLLVLFWVITAVPFVVFWHHAVLLDIYLVILVIVIERGEWLVHVQLLLARLLFLRDSLVLLELAFLLDWVWAALADQAIFKAAVVFEASFISWIYTESIVAHFRCFTFISISCPIWNGSIIGVATSLICQFPLKVMTCFAFDPANIALIGNENALFLDIDIISVRKLVMWISYLFIDSQMVSHDCVLVGTIILLFNSYVIDLLCFISLRWWILVK